MHFGTYPTGWYIEGDLPNQVAVSTGSHCTVLINSNSVELAAVKHRVRWLGR